MCFNVTFLLKRGKIEKIILVGFLENLKYEIVSASYISPLCFLNNFHVKNLPYTFLRGHDRQTLFVSVEVSSPDGNFDILGKSFL